MAEGVTLESAQAADATLLGNLLELYIHDLSAFFLRVQLGPDGRYGYHELPSFLDASPARMAFVIRQSGQIAGFALVKRGSPASDDPNVMDVAEFFVLRRFRGHGVGRAAAKQLWDRLPGSWTVRASLKNPDAVSFWRGAVAAYAGEHAIEAEHTIDSSKWAVFFFESGRIKP